MSKLFESACNITATINIEPSTQLDLDEGDVLTVDMLTDDEDESLADLISIVDSVTVEEITGINSYRINATINDDVAAVSLYQWIYANTNVKNDEDMDQYVAPGLPDLVNGGSAPEADDNPEDLDATADYEELADETDMYNESVSSKFARYRKLYEAAHELNEAEALNDDKDEEGGEGDDDFSDIFGDAGSSEEGGEDKDKDEDKDEDKDDKDKNSDEDSEDEDVPMTAVVLTVKKDDADKCKDEMVEAGIAEDDIEIIDSDDEDDENSKIKVDVNSVKELKDYLSGKGIDLEEKIGGEIVDDDDSESKDDEDKDKDEDKEDKDGEGGEDDFSDMDFGDLFADDEESSDEGK